MKQNTQTPARGQPQASSRRRSRRRRPSRGMRILRRVLLAVTAVILLFVGYTGYRIWAAINQTYQPVEAATDEEDLPIQTVTKSTGEPFTVLLLGVDSRGKNDRGRTDTIILAVANPQEQKVTLMSIPRDTYVKIAGKDKSDKINHSYSLYGLGTLMKTVENFVDIPVDYYVTINFEGFEQLIDEIGGIRIDVPKRMYYKAHDITIDLHPGPQTLNGYEALGYARYRNDSDFARNERQQEVIRALVDQAVSLRNIDNFYAILRILGDNVQTNIPPKELPRLFNQFRSLRSSDIETLTVNGTPQRFGRQNLSYVVVDEAERQRLHRELQARLQGVTVEELEMLRGRLTSARITEHTPTIPRASSSTQATQPATGNSGSGGESGSGTKQPGSSGTNSGNAGRDTARDEAPVTEVPPSPAQPEEPDTDRPQPPGEPAPGSGSTGQPGGGNQSSPPAEQPPSPAPPAPPAADPGQQIPPPVQ